LRTDFGIATTPRCVSQRMTTCAMRDCWCVHGHLFQKWTITLIASRSFIARYPSGTPTLVDSRALLPIGPRSRIIAGIESWLHPHFVEQVNAATLRIRCLNQPTFCSIFPFEPTPTATVQSS